MDWMYMNSRAPSYTKPDNCEGSTLSLFANASNADLTTATFTWTGPDGFTSNAMDPELADVTFANNGSYVVTITTEEGCTITESVTVDNIQETPATPTISSNSPVCINEVLTLTILEQYAGTNVSYQWINGAGQTIGTGASVVLSANDPTAISPFTVIVTVDGCSSDVSSPYTVKINSLPIATATNNGPICSGEEVTLSASFYPNASYEWTNAAGNVISTDQNFTVFGQNVTETFTVSITSADGCVSNPAATTTVQVNTVPVISNISGGSSYCEGLDITLTADNSATTGQTEVIYTWIGPNNFSYTAISSDPAGPFTVVLPNANETDEGTYTLVLTSDNGCVSEPVSVNVTLDGEPVTPVLALDGSLCKGDDLVLSVANPYSGTPVSYEWFFDATGTGFSSAVSIGTTVTPTNIITGVGVGNSGDYYVVVTVDNCVSSPSNVGMLTVVNPDALPSVLDMLVCEGEGIQLLGNGNFDLYEWSGPNGFLSNVKNPFIGNATPDMAGTYTLVVYENGCPSSESTVDVAVSPYPQTPTLVQDGPQCAGGSVTLTVTSPIDNGTSTYTWYDAETNVVLASTTAPSYTLTNVQLSDAGGYYVVMTSAAGCSSLLTDASNGGGTPSASEFVEVVIFDTPSNQANAGTDIFLCGGTEASLSGVNPSIGSGNWTSPTGATIPNPNQADTEVLDLMEGENIFVWTLSNGTCTDYDSDTVSVFVTSTANDIALAGDDQQLCADTDVIGGTVTLGGSPSSSVGVVGTWTQSAGQASQGVVIVDPNNPNTNVTGVTGSDAGTEYTFTWTFSNGNCGDISTDEVVITVYTIPNSAADAGDDIQLCGGTTSALEGVSPLVGTGTWTSPSGATIANPNQADTEVLDLTMGDNVFVWTLSNGACTNYDSDTIIISITSDVSDVTNAGNDQDLCADTDISATTISLGGNAASSVGVTGTWTQSATQASQGVVIVDPNDPNTDVTGIVGSEAGTVYTFTWTFSNGNCGDFSTDEVVITVHSIPTDLPYAGEDTFACGSDTITLTADDLTHGAGFWSSDNPSVEIISPEESTTIVTGLTTGENVIYYTLSNGACTDYAQDTIVVTSDASPIAENDVDSTSVGTPVTINVTDNDDFFGVTGWEITVVENPFNGTVTNNGDGTFEYTPNENFVGTDQFVYQICNTNCSDLCVTAIVTIKVGADAGDECVLPTIFTPNGDGVNDQIIIYCLTEYPENELIVFNRWGDEVYREAGYLNTWEGTYDGQPLPQGTYFYILKLNDADNTVLQGYIMLKR